jgi:inosine-uridine nucleoside N-ribohydrolase
MFSNTFTILTILVIFASSVFANSQIPVIFSSDHDIDDHIAVIYALHSEELDVRGITYQGTGFSHAGKLINDILLNTLFNFLTQSVIVASSQNIVNIFDDIYRGKDVPVLLGADYNLYETDKSPDSPGCTYSKAIPEGAGGRRDTDLLYGLNRKLKPSKRQWYDARKGFNTSQDFADLIDSTIKETNKKPTIISIGPATNIATLLRDYPHYVEKIERIVWAAGSLKVKGTVPNNPEAEYYLYLDCVAAQELFNYKLNILLLPDDFMHKLPVNPAFFDKLSKLNSFYGKFVHELLSIYRDLWPGGGFFDEFFFWDTKAVAAVKNIGVKKIIPNRNLAVTCKGGDLKNDGHLVYSHTPVKANLKLGIEPIINKNQPENSPFYKDLLRVLSKAK